MKGIRYDVDERYIPTLGMTMAAGRNFSPAFSTDSSGIILNETAAKNWVGVTKPLATSLRGPIMMAAKKRTASLVS